MSITIQSNDETTGFSSFLFNYNWNDNIQTVDRTDSNFSKIQLHYKGTWVAHGQSKSRKTCDRKDESNGSHVDMGHSGFHRNCNYLRRNWTWNYVENRDCGDDDDVPEAETAPVSSQGESENKDLPNSPN
ncbi:hypothetical protein V3C99_003417 [Haemonchus contortus]